jgi:glutathione S-transferase
VRPSLYDGGRAPNPRRVRIFLAEKGIKIPMEQVDIESG